MTDVDQGPRIRLERSTRRWRARFAGHVIADSQEALVLHERGHGPVVYFPRGDVSMEYMARTDKVTHCPLKGDATHYTLLMDGHFAENAVWSYETPIEDVSEILGRIAFYPGQVEVYEVDQDTVRTHREEDRSEIDEVVQHTDSGGGRSQREPWAPNVPAPEA